MEKKKGTLDTSSGQNGCYKSTTNGTTNGELLTQQISSMSVGQSPNGNTHVPARQIESGIDAEDEYCVYTYKGDSRAAADLPSSFYKYESSHPQDDQSSSSSASNQRTGDRKLNGGSGRETLLNGVQSRNNNNNGAAASGNVFSPDMDFLEMDFDPGGAGDDEDDDEGGVRQGAEPFSQENLGLLARERNLFSSGITSANTSGAFQPLPPPVQPPANSSSKSPDNSSNGAALDTTDGDAVAGPSRRLLNGNPETIPTHSKSPESSRQATSSPTTIHPPTTFPSLFPNLEAGSSAASVRDPSPPPTCVKPRLFNGNLLRSPAAASQFSLRLVKSNTLPEIGRHLRRDSGGCGTPSSSTGAEGFPPVRTSGMSFSVPVIQDEPHFTAVLNTTSSSSSSKTPEDCSVELEVGSVMIWTVEDAYKRSRDQIATSACGATAVCNALSALGYESICPAYVNRCVGTRVRDEEGDLPSYLFSRSGAGATDKDLIAGVARITEGSVKGRFFQLRPSVSPESLSKWLLHWICKGAVPILTRNLQVVPSTWTQPIPDAWHHQMVFGVSPGILYLTNPIECVEVDGLLPELTSSSSLLIRRNDVLRRRGERTDLRLLTRHTDPRWNEMNVLGQVANIILEDSIASNLPDSRRVITPHIQIPADYRGGVTLFIHETAPAFPSLITTPDL